ncbi:MAG: type II toxin-antitoxin system Phd/YefM family antitoxin [Acidobacteriota bacterium]|jgi:PHD/YefM family antitoxin component YafN of YafNO toxin-antitoxin module|nr:type II toxin-antitoxin system Phd/YefM family antitoxin [Acidobacteriota bacterium]
MGITADTLNSLVSITQFNKGQAAKIFDRLKTERRLVVLKNNVPSAVILSPEEYVRLSQAEEDARLLQVAEAQPVWERQVDGAAGLDIAEGQEDSYTLGKKYFGKHSSGATDLSVTYKERIRKNLHEKYKGHL